MKFLAVLAPFLFSLSTVAQTAGPVRLAPEAASARIDKNVLASYPQKASANGVEGTVVLSVLISEAGAVKEGTVSSGDPDLAQAAIDAIKQWKYTPYSVDGKPTPVETQVRFGFHLKGPPFSFAQEEATSFPVSQAIPRMGVSPSVTAGLAVKKVEPIDPQELRDARIQGTVIRHAIIDTRGTLVVLNLYRGPRSYSRRRSTPSGIGNIGPAGSMENPLSSIQRLQSVTG